MESSLAITKAMRGVSIFVLLSILWTFAIFLVGSIWHLSPPMAIFASVGFIPTMVMIRFIQDAFGRRKR